MAPTSHGNLPIGMPAHRGQPNAIGHNEPPPSTLAAQLVDNISTSSRSSHPDDNRELKRLQARIDQVCANPGLLVTESDRIQHNNLILYVCGVLLDGQKWHDPFADYGRLRTQATSIVDLLVVTIAETPQVLSSVTDGEAFLSRGREPLWLWILPKVFKMLGHEKNLPIATAIESLVQKIFVVTSQDSELWQLRSQLMDYLRANLATILSKLKGSTKDTSDSTTSIDLPTKAFLETIPDAVPKKCTFTIKGPEQAVRHAASLAKMINNTIASRSEPQPPASMMYRQYSPWLCDHLQTLISLQISWSAHVDVGLISTLQTALDVAAAHNDSTGAESVISHKASSTLAIVCSEIFEKLNELLGRDEGDQHLESILSRALVHLARETLRHRPLSVLVSSRLLPRSPSVSLDSPNSDGDLPRSIELLRHVASNSPQTALGKGIQPEDFSDDYLRQQVEALSDAVEDPLQQHPSKKGKLDNPLTVPHQWIWTKIHSMVGDISKENEVPSCDELDARIIDLFPQKNEDWQCQILEIISHFPCSVDRTLTVARNDPNSPLQFQCVYCSKWDTKQPRLSSEDPHNVQLWISQLYAKIIQLDSFQASNRTRVFGMVALRRLAKHSRDPQFLDFESSVTARWCLDSLKSSLRELRIASARTFSIYFAATDQAVLGAQDTSVQRQRRNALEFLKTLSDRNVPNLYEVCILAWGQIGRVVTDDELGIALFALVGFLGHRHTIVSAWAFNELLNLADARGMSPRRLFQPFWPSLAFSVVQDVVAKPQTANAVAELLQLGGGVAELLLLVQQHALPWLVMKKKKDVIQKIAEARGEVDLKDLCLHSTNFGPIMAHLLIQDVPDPEQYAMAALLDISESFITEELKCLKDHLEKQPLLVTLELFKAAADGDENRKKRTTGALLLMANLLNVDTKEKEKKEKEKKEKEKKKKDYHIIGGYIQGLALGLTAKLSEAIADSNGANTPFQERRRCLRAMEEMIRVCRSYVSMARPQISACLMSALASDELRSAAFSCWSTMMTSMDEQDVEALIETTFFIIGHYWQNFDGRTKEGAKSLLAALLDRHLPVLTTYSNQLPLRGYIEELEPFAAKIRALQPALDTRERFAVFTRRLGHENPGVIQEALVELVEYLATDQAYLQTSAISEQPDSIVALLERSLLDCAAKYNGWNPENARLCAKAFGLIGCLDSNCLDTVRDQQQFMLVYNFAEANETTDFVAHVLGTVMVKAFLSTPDLRFQGFLSYAMQELLDTADFTAAVSMKGKKESESIYRKWMAMSETAKETLQPFLSSRFTVQAQTYSPVAYPIFTGKMSYAKWIRPLVLDLLQSPQNKYSEYLFPPLCRVIRVQDLTITEFLLPYVVLHVIVGQNVPVGQEAWSFKTRLTYELFAILRYEPPDNASYAEKEELKLYYQAIFRIIDYFTQWLKMRKLKVTPGVNQSSSDPLEVENARAQDFLDSLNPELITKRAMDCGEYARALFSLEPLLNSTELVANQETDDRLLKTVQEIYTQIDDPDGLEGISCQLKSLSLDQQALNHRKAGRWTAAQTWYEIRLAEAPENTDIQLDLLTCLKESGQHDVLLNCIEGIKSNSASINKLIPYAVEASWATNRWKTLEQYLRLYNVGDVSEVFNLGIAQALLCLKGHDFAGFQEQVRSLREKVAGSMTYAATSSLKSCHDLLLRCHVLSDLEMIVQDDLQRERQPLLTTLSRRLEVLGPYAGDKQYLLGVRRAAMELMRPKYGNQDISSLWLSTARLARKSGSMHQSFNAVLHAQQLGDGSATIENARLLYKDGHHHKAIQVLQLAINTNSFISENPNMPPSSSKSPETQRNLLTARAYLLLAKWLDSTGQTHSGALRSKYQQAAKTHSQWEKGHYYLGRHYKKVLESEEALKPDDQSDAYVTGETAKLVIENYLRSLNFGTKYLYQTLPRILTLWLDLGAQVDKAPEGKLAVARELWSRRKLILQELHKHLQKNLVKMPAFIFYTALPQIVARIAHPHQEVFRVLEQMIVKVVEAHPRQASWSIFPFMTARNSSDRRARSMQVLITLKGPGRKAEGTGMELKQLLRVGEKLAEQLLLACNNGEFRNTRTIQASITRDLNFNHKCTPSPLVVPIEACLTATLPTLTDNMRKHKAFSRDVITIDSFLDQVLVLGSLAKPRKLTARGSDGNLYGLLIKPKDDLRTDQRLMEFNGLISRSLKRDAESSRRQLYIKTYAVTPLNEECGIIEWVDGPKTLRDILLSLYKARNIAPNYHSIESLMKEASASEANIHLFTQNVLRQFPAVLPEWFVSQFPNPSAWFAARLRYTRSCAVMSMVGTILGLGDRHGENVLIEEGNGGIFHVDFNCLFDKGLTFTQPERVPFRLTHNMVAAMGIHGYEGPFRQCSELTLQVLRQQQETLMTILEAFVYDPTLDLQRTKRRSNVNLQPTSVVQSIKRKIRGLLPNESIPLGVEGQVEELIKQAVDPRNLTAMYIGWCPFL